MPEIKRAENPYDGLQMTVYTTVKGRSGIRQPDKRGWLQIQGAVELARRGYISEIVIGAVNFYERDDGLTLSEVYAHPLRYSLLTNGLNHVKVIAEGELLEPKIKADSSRRKMSGAVETSGEVDFAISRGWQRFLSETYSKHSQRVAKLYRSRGITVAGGWDEPLPDSKGVRVLTSHDILGELTEEADRSYQLFGLVERVKNFEMIFDHRGDLLPLIARRLPDQIKGPLAG